MEGAHVRRQLVPDRVVHLEEDGLDVPRMLAGEGDASASAERHREVAVHASRWGDDDRFGGDDVARGEAVAEEVAQGHLHCRVALVVPIHAEDEIAEYIRTRGR